jgi:biotin carboxylase
MLDRGDDLAAAWRQTSTAGGRMRLDKPPPSRYLIEERMYGPECSVECLVVAGEVAFTNITAKRVLPGRYPVEIGHTLPAPLDTATEKELRTCMQTLVDATGYRYGILHGEWILKPEGPALVECAARIPGDEITNLLSLAYDVPFIGRYAALLAGDCDPPTGGMPGSAVQHSAITFFTPDPGTVQEITGVEEAAAAPGVRDVQVETTVGAEIRPMRTSGDRVGHIIAVGRDAEEATRRVEYAADLIRIVTDET